MLENYSWYIDEQVNAAAYGEPILTEDVTDNLIRRCQLSPQQAKSIVNTNLYRKNKNKEIERFDEGAYFKPQITVFGITPLNPSQVISKMYMKKENEYFGYETGPSLMNKLGFTTQLPKYRYIATNKYTQRGNKVIEKYGVVLRRPKVHVNKENKPYLQLLDIIVNKDDVFIEVANKNIIYANFIEKHQLDYGVLIAYAKKYYGKGVLLQIADIAEATKL